MTKPRGARKKGEPKLVGRGDAADILGIPQTNLLRLKDLPEQYQSDVKATGLWREWEIRELARKRKPKPKVTPNVATTQTDPVLAN
jgi:hypothetical protein